MKKILHYVYDPLCGWCYAAEALTEAAARRAPGQFEIRLHAGGLFDNTRLSDAKRAHIRIADARIGEMTGQVFSQAYMNGLLNDPGTIYDSAQPMRGILAADAVKPGSCLPMLKALQRAHYRSGLRIVELPTIVAQVGARFALLPHERFYGNAEEFAELVAGILAPKRVASAPEQEIAKPIPAGSGRCEGGSCSL